MTASANNNWGYPTEQDFAPHPTPAPAQQEEIVAKPAIENNPAKERSRSKRLITVVRLLVLIAIIFGAAALILFPFKDQASALLRKISLPGTQQASRISVHSVSQLPTHADRQYAAFVYRCGETYKNSPGQNEDCASVETPDIRDDRGNQYITQNW